MLKWAFTMFSKRAESLKDHSLMNKYRVVVGGTGVVYSGEDISEAEKAFSLFVELSKDELGKPGDTVKLFKDYQIVKEWHRPPVG